MLPFARIMTYGNKIKEPDLMEVYAIDSYNYITPSSCLAILFKNGDLFGIGGGTSSNYLYGNGHAANTNVPTWTYILPKVKRLFSKVQACNMVQTTDNKFLYCGVGGGFSTTLTTVTSYTDMTSLFTATFSQAQLGQIKDIVAPDASNVFVLLENGVLYAMGSNNTGQFGLGSATRQTKFVQINTNVKRFCAANNGVMLQKNDNTFWFSGRNENKRLSNAATAIFYTWTQYVSFLGNRNVLDFNLKTDAFYIISQLTTTDAFELRVNGSTVDGNVGNNTTAAGGVFTVEVNFPGDVNPENVKLYSSSGAGYGAMLNTGYTVCGTGRNTFGKLAQGTVNDVYQFTAPKKAVTLSAVELYSAGDLMNVYMDRTGDVYVSGYIPGKTGSTAASYSTEYIKFDIPNRYNP